MFVDGAAGKRNEAGSGLWKCGVGVALDCASSGLHVRLRRPVQAVRGSTCAEWLAANEGLTLARQLQLTSLVLFTDSKSVASDLASMLSSSPPICDEADFTPRGHARTAAAALHAAGCITTVKWVPRSQNKAHRLAARALEAGRH